MFLYTSPQSEVCKRSYGLPKCWEDVALMANNKEYNKGEGGDFLQVWAMVNLVNLVSLCMPVARPCTKSVLTMH